MSPCDFLLFALSKKIRDEAPSLEEPIQDIFKLFIAGEEADRITPEMALAIKMDVNLSHRQYVQLSSQKVLGKLPHISKVRKAADHLDPGNVYYEVVDKISGEVIRDHAAVAKSGITYVDQDLGH